MLNDIKDKYISFTNNPNSFSNKITEGSTHR